MFNAKKAQQIANNPQLHSILVDIKIRASHGLYKLECPKSYVNQFTEAQLNKLGFEVTHLYGRDLVVITWSNVTNN